MSFAIFATPQGVLQLGLTAAFVASAALAMTVLHFSREKTGAAVIREAVRAPSVYAATSAPDVVAVQVRSPR